MKNQLLVSTTLGDITTIGDQPPAGWIPPEWIQVAPNRWVAPWPACRYRRLNVKVPNQAAPQIKPLCVLSGSMEPVDVQTCMACDKFIAPQQQIQFDDAILNDLFSRDFPDILPDGQQHPLFGYSEEELNEIEYFAFMERMETVPQPVNNPLHPRRTLATRWGVPCSHRQRRKKPKSDCGTCNKHEIFCNNPAAEHYDTKVVKSMCEGCPVAELLTDE